MAKLLKTIDNTNQNLYMSLMSMQNGSTILENS